MSFPPQGTGISAGPGIDTTAFHNGGDSFGAAAILGTNDNNDLRFERNNLISGRIVRNGANTLDALLWGSSASLLSARSLAEFNISENADRIILLSNAQGGNVSQAGFEASADVAVVNVGATSSTFSTTGFGLKANQAYVRAVASQTILNLIAFGSASAVAITVNGSERLRVLAANTLQGNAGLKVEGGSGVHTLTLSGGASAASSIAIGIASEKIGAFGATPVVQPTGVAVTAAGIHAALVSLGWITA